MRSPPWASRRWSFWCCRACSRLVLMMPLLCLYADFVGILGGMFVGVAMLGLSPGSIHARNHFNPHA